MDATTAATLVNPQVTITGDPPHTDEGGFPTSTIFTGAKLAKLEVTVTDVEKAISSPAFKSLIADIKPVVSGTKLGVKTSEFWAGIAASLTDVITRAPQTDKLALLGLAAVYAIARGIAKHGK